MCKLESFDERNKRLALETLQSHTADNLQAFNNSVPHASWLRRSEIKRFTSDLILATESAPVIRQTGSLGRIWTILSRRVRTLCATCTS